MARVLVTCPQCKEERSLRPCDAKRAKLCRRCHCRNIAKKGWQATKAKYGEKVAVKHVRNYRLNHPSSLEQLVMATLDAMEIAYEREYWLESANGNVYLVDFVIALGSTKYAIEVNGTWVHQYHEARDRRKTALLRRRGYTVICLDDQDVKSTHLESLLQYRLGIGEAVA